MPTVYGYEVLELEPNRRDTPTVAQRRAFRRFDPRLGAVHVLDVPGIGTAERSFSLMFEGRTELQAARDFLDARAGRLVPFWMPTWNRDFVLTGDLASNAPAMVVKARGYTAKEYPFPARKYVAFLHPSGTKIYRKITSASASTTTETLTLDSAPGVAVPAGTMVSFLVLCRLADDAVSIKWRQTKLAEMDVDLVEVPREAPA